MRRVTCLTLLLAAATLLACGPADEGGDPKDRDGSSDSRADPRAQSLADPLVEALDKAERVEDLGFEQKARMDDALRRMEGGDAEDDEAEAPR